MRVFGLVFATLLLLGLACGDQQRLPTDGGADVEVTVEGPKLPDLLRAEAKAADGGTDRRRDHSAPDASTNGKTCGQAIPVVLVAGKAGLAGDTTGTSNTFDLPNNNKCTNTQMQGADLFYKLVPNTPTLYGVTLTASYDASLYVFTSCNDPTGSCITGSETHTHRANESDPEGGGRIEGGASRSRRRDSDGSKGSFGRRRG